MGSNRRPLSLRRSASLERRNGIAANPPAYLDTHIRRLGQLLLHVSPPGSPLEPPLLGAPTAKPACSTPGYSRPRVTCDDHMFPFRFGPVPLHSALAG